MMKKLGIIAAAGKAQRFGGTLKELLPCNPDHSLLRRHSEMLDMDQVLITNIHKMQVQMPHIVDRCQPMLQCFGQDLLGALKTGIQLHADEYYFVMADTYLPSAPDLTSDLTFGTFWTTMPERFGVLRSGGIVDKEVGDPGYAWGCFAFSNEVAEYWRNNDLLSCTHALNEAMVRFEWSGEIMPYYYDMASFEDYKKFLCERNNDRQTS